MENKREIEEKDNLIGIGVLFFVSLMFAAVLNYFYHLFMGRLLGPVQYGVLGSLFAIIYMVTFTTSTFNFVISKYASEFHNKKQFGHLKDLIRTGSMKIMLYGGLVFILCMISLPLLAHFMNIDNYLGLFIVGLIAYIGFLGTLFTGILNGMQKFVWQNCSSVAGAGIKFVVAVLLVLAGFGVAGALGGILAGSIVGLAIGIYPLRRILSHSSKEKVESKKILRYAIPVFFATLFLVLTITLDQILVKHYLTSEQAGFYAAAGMISKIIFFGSGFLAAPLFPKIISRHVQGKSSSSLLRKTLFMTFLLALAGVLLYIISPELIVNLLYGKEYLAITSIIALFGASIGLYSLNNILMTYNLAKERYSFIIIFALGLIFLIGGIVLFHSNLVEIVKVHLVTQLLIFIAIVTLTRRELFG